MLMKPAIVSCHSRYKLDEYPRSFVLDNTRLSIMDIEDRWYSPGCSYFKVLADDARGYILRRDDRSGEWSAGPMPPAEPWPRSQEKLL
jgi:hypothetical protein